MSIFKRITPSEEERLAELNQILSRMQMSGQDKIPWGKIRSFTETDEEADLWAGKIFKKLGFRII